MSYESLVKRIERMKALGDPNSKEVYQALYRIGTVLQAEIRLNIGRKKIIDQGGLLNSIKFQLNQNDQKAVLEVGSFGIKYAGMNEFGGDMTQKQVRAMFAALRSRGKKPNQAGGKGIVTIYKDQTGYWKARPFIRPAFKKHSSFIVDLLRSIGKK